MMFTIAVSYDNPIRPGEVVVARSEAFGPAGLRSIVLLEAARWVSLLDVVLEHDALGKPQPFSAELAAGPERRFLCPCEVPENARLALRIRNDGPKPIETFSASATGIER